MLSNYQIHIINSSIYYQMKVPREKGGMSNSNISKETKIDFLIYTHNIHV